MRKLSFVLRSAGDFFSVPKMAQPGQLSENILVYLKWPGRKNSRLHILRAAFIFKGETQKLERNARLGAKPAAELAKQIKTRSGMTTFLAKPAAERPASGGSGAGRGCGRFTRY